MAVTRDGDPGPGLVLAREHHRLGADPAGQDRHAGLGARARSSGSPTAGSPPRRTGGSCSRAPAGTSSGRSCAPSPRWSRRPCRGRAATSRSPGTCRSRKSGSPTPTDRFVICYNPDAAERDAAIRAELISKLEELIAGTDKLTVTKRAELRGKISTMPGLNRFLRVTPGGLLRTDKTKAKAEENLDGKYLLRCADPQLSAEDIAAGYKQLLEVERGWRDMKSVLDLRPVYHRLEERIRAHVLLCWLALLLVRVAENTDRADLARDAPRTRPDPPRHLHRARRHLPAVHRTPQARP